MLLSEFYGASSKALFPEKFSSKFGVQPVYRRGLHMRNQYYFMENAHI